MRTGARDTLDEQHVHSVLQHRAMTLLLMFSRYSVVVRFTGLCWLM
jgi:hypothetical protein